MDLSTKAGFQLFYKVQMFSFWSSLGHFLNKQILLLEVSPALCTNRLGLFIFTLWSETTHLVAIYNIYIASDTTRQSQSWDQSSGHTEDFAGPALKCKRDLVLHHRRWHKISVYFLDYAYQHLANNTKGRLYIQHFAKLCDVYENRPFQKSCKTLGSMISLCQGLFWMGFKYLPRKA